MIGKKIFVTSCSLFSSRSIRFIRVTRFDRIDTVIPNRSERKWRVSWKDPKTFDENRGLSDSFIRVNHSRSNEDLDFWHYWICCPVVRVSVFFSIIECRLHLRSSYYWRVSMIIGIYETFLKWWSWSSVRICDLSIKKFFDRNSVSSRKDDFFPRNILLTWIRWRITVEMSLDFDNRFVLFRVPLRLSPYVTILIYLWRRRMMFHRNA